MGFTLLAFSEVVNAGATNEDISALASDQVHNIQNGHYVLRDDTDLLFAVALGPSITRARFESASLRQVLLPYVGIIDRAGTPSAVPRVADYRGQGIRFRATEEIIVSTTNNLGMGTERHYVLVWLQYAVLPRHTGRIYTARFTGTTTLAANAWTNVPLTADQGLAPGQYAIVGMRAISAGCIAARLIIPGQFYRPGVLGRTAVGDLDFDAFRYNAVGTFGIFNQYALPQAEFLSASADTTEEVYLDLIKIA